MADRRFHFGHWLKKQIATREKTVTAFAAEVGISPARLWGLFDCPSPGIRSDNIARLARGLGLTYDQIESKLDEARGVGRAPAAA